MILGLTNSAEALWWLKQQENLVCDIRNTSLKPAVYTTRSKSFCLKNVVQDCYGR